jgi:uncharacterized protein (TIGR00725 family)
MALQIGVIGAGECSKETGEKAYAVGRAIARAGAAVICGGMGGVMESACRGATEAGGTTIGILPGGTRGSGNPLCTYEIVTNVGHARNVFIAHSSDGLIAVSGGYGTLSEIAVSLKLGKPVVGLESWDIRGMKLETDPEKAVALLLSKVKK